MTLFFTLISTSVYASEAQALPGYDLLPTPHRSFCVAAARLLSDDIACRNNSAKTCQSLTRVLIEGRSEDVIENIASNEYGFTEVFRSTAPDSGESTFLYVDKFRGSRVPRLTQTYLVNAKNLAEVLALQPGPVNLERRQTQHLKIAEETNAKELSQVLASGTKLADDLLPVIHLLNGQYAIKYGCVGESYSEGDRFCPHIGRLAVVKIEPQNLPQVYCDFKERGGKSKRNH